MKLSASLISTLAVLSATNAISLPDEVHALAVRIADPSSDIVGDAILSSENALEKRKGGGGKGGGSGGGGSKSGGGSTSSGKTSSTSNVGGSTKSGSGVTRGYAGGKYYSGGAATPYAAGSTSPRGITPAFVGVPLFFGGAWAYGAYYYPYGYHHTYYNASRNRTRTRRQQDDNANVTLPVACLCGDYEVCGCDENDDPAFYNELIGNGSYAAMNQSLIQVADVNGTQTLVLNGTLANGTTAPGGTDDAAGSLRIPAQAGLWALAGAVGYAVMSLS